MTSPLPLFHPRPAPRGILPTALLFAALTVVLLTLIVLATGERQNSDWHNTFVPTALALLEGRSPYEVESFYNPPWLLPFLVPFALLPAPLSGLIVRCLLVACFAAGALALGASRTSLAIIFLSHPVLASIVYANVDALPLLGLLCPRPAGLLLLAIKPQIGAGVMIVWAIEAWRRAGVRGLITLCAPLAVLTAASAVLFPPWPFNLSATRDLPWNLSLWPFTIPFGLGLLYVAVRYGKLGHALIASPLLSPYVAIQSWSGAMVGLSPSVRWAATVALMTWLPILASAVWPAPKT